MPAPDRLLTPRAIGERPTTESVERVDPLEDREAHWERHGFGVYAIRERASGEYLGVAGLRAVATGDEVEVTLGLVPETLAAEVLGELVRVAFELLDLPQLVAWARVDDPARDRVLEEVGFEVEGEVERDGVRHTGYRLRAASGSAHTTVFDQATLLYTARASEGDREAFERLYERVAPALRAWIRLRTSATFRARVDPEEVLQETWMRTLRRLPELEPGAPFRPWLFRVARYVLIEHSREVPFGVPEASGEDWVAARPDPASGAATHVARADALEAFLERADALDERDRELVLLRGLEGRSFDEIAERLGGEAGTMGKRWQRLRARLILDGPPEYLL